LGLTEARIPESQTLFPEKDEVKQIEMAAAQKLKAMFAEIDSYNWAYEDIGQRMQPLTGCAIKECDLTK
jgi:hypothetical protein